MSAALARLGFGTANLYGGEQRAQEVRLVQRAIGLGIGWIDTAPLYGHGAAEAIVGDALCGRRDAVTLVSKAGILPTRITNAYRLRAKAARTVNRMAGRTLLAEPAPPSPRFNVFEPIEVRRSVERSLKALQTDRIDVLLLHECSAAEATNDALLRELERLMADGKVLGLGIATQPNETATLALTGGLPYRHVQLGYMPNAAYPLPAHWVAPVGLSVHSVLRTSLARVRHALATDEAAREMARSLGIDPQAADLPGLILAGAVAQPGVATVLFSTRDEDRLAGLAGATKCPSEQSAAVAALLAWIDING